jgi:hypothetical protein
LKITTPLYELADLLSSLRSAKKKPFVLAYDSAFFFFLSWLSASLALAAKT